MGLSEHGVSTVLTRAIERISEEFSSPYTLLCALGFATLLFVVEYFVFVRNAGTAAENLKPRKIQELHIDVSSEEPESVEEESAEKERFHLPVATGVIGIVAQSLNLAAGKSFATVEALKLANALQNIAQRLATTVTAVQAQSQNASDLNLSEQQQLLKTIQHLQRNATEIASNLRPESVPPLGLLLNSSAITQNVIGSAGLVGFGGSRLKVQ